VSFCESDPRVAEWLAGEFCIIRGSRSIVKEGALIKGASNKGESGVPEEVPPQAPSQMHPIVYGQGSPSSLKL